VAAFGYGLRKREVVGAGKEGGSGVGAHLASLLDLTFFCSLHVV